MKLGSQNLLLICLGLLLVITFVSADVADSDGDEWSCFYGQLDNGCNGQGTCLQNGICVCRPKYYGNKCQYQFKNESIFGSTLIFVVVIVWILLPLCLFVCIYQCCNNRDPEFLKRMTTFRKDNFPKKAPAKQTVRNPFQQQRVNQHQNYPVQMSHIRPSGQIRQQQQMGYAQSSQFQVQQRSQQQGQHSQQKRIELVSTNQPKPSIPVPSNQSQSAIKHLFTYSEHNLTVNSVISYQFQNDFKLENTGFLSAGQGKVIHNWKKGGQKLWELKGFVMHKQPITVMKYFHDQAHNKKYIITGGGDAMVKVWNIANPQIAFQQIISHSCQQGAITAINVFMFKNEALLATSGQTGGLKIWKLLGKNVIAQFGQRPVISFDSIFNGSQILACAERGPLGTITCYEYPEGKQRYTFNVGTQVKFVEFEPETSQLVVAGNNQIFVYFATDLWKKINCNMIEAIKVIKCQTRGMPFILVSSIVRTQLSQIQIYNFQANQPVTMISLNPNEIVVSIDAFYDKGKKKIVFAAADLTNQCKVYEF